LVVWKHPTRAELDQTGLFDLPTEAIDIDIKSASPTRSGAASGHRPLRRSWTWPWSGQTCPL